MNILVATTSFPRKEGDIPGRFVLDLIREIEKQGTKSVVIRPSYRDDEDDIEITDVSIIRAGKILPGFLKLSAESSIASQYSADIIGKIRIMIYFVFQLYHYVVRGNDPGIDLLHSHWLLPQGLSGAIASSILNKPHVITTHAGGLAAAYQISPGGLLVRVICRKNTALTAVSQHLSRMLFHLIAKSTPISPRIHRIPMGADDSTFSPSPVSASIPTVLFVGRLDEGKGLEFLLKAADNLREDFPDLYIRIVGDGPQRKSVEQMVRNLELEDHVYLPGSIPNRLLPSEFAACHMVAVPSTTTGEVGEGLGLVAVEACMSARPVVASAIGGIPEVVENGKSGILIEEGNPAQLAGCMEYLFNNREMMLKFGKTGKKHMEKFTIAGAALQFCNLYTSLCSEESRGP